MGGKSTIRGSAEPGGPGDGEVTKVFLGRDPAAGPQPAEPASPLPHRPTELAAPPPPTEAVAFPGEVVPQRLETNIVRYGPGVPVILPVSQGGRTAEHVWQGQPPPGRRPHRLRRLAGLALTVILLAASGAVLYVRFLYHAPFHVTGVVISQRAPVRCGVRVTGRITTNGAAGTVSYQWLFRPGRQQPVPLSQSVTAGQDAVDVIAAVEGSGHGVARQAVTLQILGPERKAASANVVVSC
jgi:hypothetical protein